MSTRTHKVALPGGGDHLIDLSATYRRQDWLMGDFVRSAVSLDSITHVHKETESSDCDGRYSCTDVIYPNLHESGRELWTFFVRHELRFLRDEGKVTRRLDYYGYPVLEVSSRHDEGFEWIRYEGCNDNCGEMSELRDHTAEAAGY